MGGAACLRERGRAREGLGLGATLKPTPPGCGDRPAVAAALGCVAPNPAFYEPQVKPNIMGAANPARAWPTGDGHPPSQPDARRQGSLSL
jgi:hypothetical protein